MSEPAADSTTHSQSRSSRHMPRLAGLIVHVLRIGIVVGVALLIREYQATGSTSTTSSDSFEISLVEAQRLFPEAVEVLPEDPLLKTRTVVSAEGESLGFFLQTYPEAEDIPGYSGPTNTLLAFDHDREFVGLFVISSADTPDYVAQVVTAHEFLSQFEAATWDELSERRTVEALSGATLTSLAVGEGILRRLGGSTPGLRFPKPVEPDAVARWFPDVAALISSTTIEGGIDITDSDGQRLGTVIRTTPAADPILGYQGPTDTLIGIDIEGRVIGIAVHATFDTEEYVDYVREEDYFLQSFNGKTIEELATLDLFEEQIEGVSGATMTSMAMADAIVARAATVEAPVVVEDVEEPSIGIRANDVGMIVIVCLGLMMTFTHLRGRRAIRIVYQVALVAYFLFVNRDLLSQALFAGWAAHGVPWRLAPGLVLLAAASFAVPGLSKRQMYCHHVCPFGAAQQLSRRISPLRWSPPRWLHKSLRVIPFALILLVILTAFGQLELNLAAMEPFDAFNWKLASWGSIAVALIGLLASCLTPMAYCQYGCPTGAVLGYVRMQERASLSRRDLAAVLCLALAVYLLQIA